MPEASLKKTPLHATHVDSGARMVPFGGWDMPVQYPQGIISEVKAVRNSAGMFDVSHMGRVEFHGAGVEKLLDRLLSANVPAIKQGRSKYHMICNERGGIIDDAIVSRLDDESFLLVINAGNHDRDMEWIRSHAADAADVEIRDITAGVAMIAVQGPDARSTVDSLSGDDLSKIRRFALAEAELDGIPCRVSRTGYTGEDGFEIMPPADKAAQLWSTLRDKGVIECGLGSRDVLRLEAGLMLHGNDLTEETNPIEAGLGWTLDLDRPGYIAADALKGIEQEGTEQILVGFQMTGQGIPRHDMTIRRADRDVGVVTSGTHSPTLDSNIGIGYVERQFAEAGTTLEIDVRGRAVEAEVTDLPFYKPPR